MALWALGLGLIVAYIAIHKFLVWRRLRHIPGASWCGWFDSWMLQRAFRGTMYDDLGQLCEQYGPLVRIAPNYVICGDPIEVRRLWAVRSQFDRSPWFKGFQVDSPNDSSISMRDRALHTALRSKLAAGYSGKDVDHLDESIDQQIANLIRLIEAKYLTTDTDFRPVDIARKVQYLTLDVISTIAFGRTFGFIDNDGVLFDYIKTTEESLPLLQVIALLPWLLNVLQSPVFKPIRPTSTDAIGLGRIMG